jgi:hypothetical protein
MRQRSAVLSIFALTAFVFAGLVAGCQASFKAGTNSAENPPPVDAGTVTPQSTGTTPPPPAPMPPHP